MKENQSKPEIENLENIVRSNLIYEDGEGYNKDIAESGEREFNEEISQLKKTANKYSNFDKYPYYYSEAMKDLYKEGGYLFELNHEDIPSSLVWLLINDKDRFLMASNEYSVIYDMLIKRINEGTFEGLNGGKDEIDLIKGEFDSYLFYLNLNGFSKEIAEEISFLYRDMELDKNEDQDKKDIIKDLELRYDWLMKEDEKRKVYHNLGLFYQKLSNLNNLLESKGFYDKGKNGF